MGGGRKFRLHLKKGYSHPPKPRAILIDGANREKLRVRRRRGYLHSRSPKEFCLTVSLPLCLCHCNWESLQAIIKGADLGKWSFISTGTDIVTLCKFTTSNPPMVYITLNISPDNNWSLYIGQNLVPRERVSSLPTAVYSLSDVYTVLRGIDRCILCTGIRDQKFTPFIE